MQCPFINRDHPQEGSSHPEEALPKQTSREDAIERKKKEDEMNISFDRFL